MNYPNYQPIPVAEDTQPHHRKYSLLQPKRWQTALLVLLTLFAGCLLLCGSCLVIYMVFPPPQENILIVGLDSREGEGFVTRTDTIMLLGIDTQRLRVNLLSIPRDLFIDVPGYGLQRINTVNVLGEVEQEGRGPHLLAESISQNFGVRIDHYIRMDFDMFVELIDAVGGVTIDVERVIVDNAYPTGNGDEVISVRFESGVQTMDGERALIYARTRHSDDDYQRAERQQQVVSALAKKLLLPTYWPAAISVLSRSIDTDMNLVDMIKVSPPVLLNAGRFDQLIIDRDYILGTQDGNAVPNYDLVSQWLRGRFD